MVELLIGLVIVSLIAGIVGLIETIANHNKSFGYILDKAVDSLTLGDED